MNNIPNRQIIADCLRRQASLDPNLLVLCTDSRGSAALNSFAINCPQQLIEIGIAEQDAVSIAAGLAACGKRPFVVSPACFLSTRSLEQARIDVAYSNQNVKLIGISGGVSYGILGMTHHSGQDIATMGSIPNLCVYLPSDRFLTQRLMESLLCNDRPAYIRVGRAAAPDVYTEEKLDFQMDRAVQVCPGTDACIIACGETVAIAAAASQQLKEKGISCRVLDMYCIKPLDRDAILSAARETRCILTVEEHSVSSGLGALVSQTMCTSKYRIPMQCIGLPDEFPYAGTAKQIYSHIGITSSHLATVVLEMLNI